jgi:hypothetical protein
MTGGAIYNNTAVIGGGVYGSIDMQGGEIYGNRAWTKSKSDRADTAGGGVYITGDDSKNFTHTGGTIYGSAESLGKKRNTAASGKGAAIYWDKGPQWRNETVSPDDKPGDYGFWLND